MKTLFNLFLFCLVFCFTWQVNAQTGNNNTIVNDNSTWSVLGRVVAPVGRVWTQYIYFDGDSIIGIHSFKKVFSCDDSLHKNIKYEGLIREEDKKTYFIPVNFDSAYLLYDFSLAEGTVFEYQDYQFQEKYSLYVKHIDTIEINGILKTRIRLTMPPPNDNQIVDTWIENIGTLSRLLYETYKLVFDGVSYALLCYYQEDELAYKNPDYFKCYYDDPKELLSIETNLNTSNVAVYPNPTNDYFILSDPKQSISNVEIFDVFGKKVYSQLHGNTIDASAFSKGLYIVKIYSINKQVSVLKIIKK
jgi:hypothetical protein